MGVYSFIYYWDLNIFWFITDLHKYFVANLIIMINIISYEGYTLFQNSEDIKALGRINVAFITQ